MDNPASPVDTADGPHVSSTERVLSAENAGAPPLLGAGGSDAPPLTAAGGTRAARSIPHRGADNRIRGRLLRFMRGDLKPLFNRFRLARCVLAFCPNFALNRL